MDSTTSTATRPRAYRAPVFSCRLVREGRIDAKRTINGSGDAGEVATELLRDSPNEQLVVMLLTTKNTLIGVHVASTGTLDSALAHPREIFRAAILANAASIIVAHNHPSGDVTPSRQDREVFDRLKEAGRVVGIRCLDALVVSGEGEVYSLAENS